MATIDKKKSFLQSLKGNPVSIIKSNKQNNTVKNGYLNQSKLDELIKQRFPTGLSTPTQKTLMDKTNKPFSPQDLFMVKQFEEASKKYKSTNYPSIQTNAPLNPMATSINASAKYSNATTGIPKVITGAGTGTGVTGTGTGVTGTGTGIATGTGTGVGTIADVKPVNVENEVEYLKGILNNPDSTDEAKAFAIKEGKRLYGTDITEKTTDELNLDAIKAQEAFITKGVESNVQGLTDAQTQALARLEAQRAGIAPQYQGLRTQASNEAMQQAKNLAEYRAARGQAMSGLRAQQELQMGADLQGRFGQIGLAEQGAIQGLENKKTEVALDFESRISQAKTQGEAEKEKFKLQQILENIKKVEAEATQKIQNAYNLEQQKLKEAAEESKSQLEFNRKKELIEFQTTESIKKANAEAQLKANQATVDYERESKEVKEVKAIPYDKNPQYISYLNEFDSDATKPSTKGKANLLAEEFLDESGKKLNAKARTVITNIRSEFGDAAATKALKNLEKLLNLQTFNLG